MNIDTFEVTVTQDEFSKFIKDYPGDMIRKSDGGMGSIWVDKATGLEVARRTHEFSSSIYTITKFKKSENNK